MDATLKEYLATECEIAASKILSENDADTVYYFSAVYAAAQRVFNIESSPDVVHLYVVSNWTHSQLNARIQALLTSPQTPGRMPSGTLENLSKILAELANRIRQDKDFKDLLTQMCRLGYAATGNGYYLLEVGKL